MSQRFSERLKMLREKQKLSQRELAKKLDMKVSAVAISQWETGISEPKMSNLKALSDYFDVDIAWLSTGRTRAREIDCNDQRVVSITAIDSEASESDSQPFIALSRDLVGEARNLCWYKVSGSSMAPLLPDSSIVIVDRAETTIKDDNLYLIDIGDGFKVKQVSQTLSGYVIRSYNEQYADELFTAQAFSKEFKVVGRVIKILTTV